MKTSFQNLFKNTTRVDELWKLKKEFFKNHGYNTKSALKKAANDGALISSTLLDFVK